MKAVFPPVDKPSDSEYYGKIETEKQEDTMITGDIKVIASQIKAFPGLDKAIGFLQSGNITGLVDGKIEIDGDRIFAIVQRYETAATDQPAFEFHKKYIDVQYLVSGEEIIGWAPSHRMTITHDYDPSKDICFGSVPGRWTPLLLQAGQAAVLFPEDGHAPKLAAGLPGRVMKIVIKIAL